MGVSSSESHDLTAFYEMLTASFGVLSPNTGFYPSLDRIVETTLGPLNLGPGGRSYNEPISCLHWPSPLHQACLISHHLIYLFHKTNREQTWGAFHCMLFGSCCCSADILNPVVYM